MGLYWPKWGECYISAQSRYFEGHWLAPELCRLPEYLASGSILALAAGYGCLWLADRGFAVTAAGEPPEVVERAAQLDLPVTFLPERIGSFSLAPKSAYDAVVALGQLHFLSLEQLGKLVAQFKRHTRLGGFHVVRALGEQTPRTADRTKTSLVPWLEWYSDWRIIQFTYQDNEVSSRYVESPYWLFDHGTTLIAKKELPMERQRQLDRAEK